MEILEDYKKLFDKVKYLPVSMISDPNYYLIILSSESTENFPGSMKSFTK